MKTWSIGLIAIALNSAGFGCMGSMELDEDVGGEREGFTYGQLQRSTSIGSGGASNNGGAWVPASEASVEGNLTANIIRVRVCHYGELDYVNLRAKQPDEGQVPLILTLETDDHFVLASQTLDKNTLTQAPVEPVGTMAVFKQTLSFTVPSALTDGRTFQLNEFICLDSSGDGSCSDEPVGDFGKMGSVLAAIASPARVIAFKALKAHLAGSTLVLEPEDPDVADTATRQMVGTLKLLDPADYLSQPNVLDLVLALHTPYGECKKMRLRTNGCFVAGTRIELGDGRILPVEYAFEGMEIMGPDGLRRRALRVEAGPEAEQVVVISTSDGHELGVTQGHPMFTARGLKRAVQLTREDSLLMATGGYAKIARISRESYAGLVYNFALDGSSDDRLGRDQPHQVVANGVVVGDLVLQHQLGTRSLGGRW